jgi:hypothetical protein
MFRSYALVLPVRWLLLFVGTLPRIKKKGLHDAQVIACAKYVDCGEGLRRRLNSCGFGVGGWNLSWASFQRHFFTTGRTNYRGCFEKRQEELNETSKRSISYCCVVHACASAHDANDPVDGGGARAALKSSPQLGG